MRDQFDYDMPSDNEKDRQEAIEEEKKYTLPCPHTKGIMCVQYPGDCCGCDPCGVCENGPQQDTDNS